MLTQHIDPEKLKIALVKIVNAQDFENTIQALKGLSPVFFQNTHAFFSEGSSAQYADICDQVCSEATKAGIYPTETLQTHCSRIYSLAAECHAARIAELEQEHQRMACEAAQIRFENYRFDEQPDIKFRSQALLDALSNLTNLDIKDSKEIDHLTVLLTTKRDALTSSILAAQAKFDAYQFDSHPTVTAKLQSIIATLSNVRSLETMNALEVSDADELAHLYVLLVSEINTLEIGIRTAETQHKTVMDAVNSESVVSRRLQAISQALHNPPATLTPMATRHYHALLADEHQALESSMTSAQARFKSACSAGATPGKASLDGTQTINERLETMISTLANLPNLAIADANEASHFQALLTMERDRLQQDIDAAEAHFQRDRERFNSEPVVSKRLQIIEQTIRDAQSSQLIAQQHYCALLTKERSALAASMAAAKARFESYNFGDSKKTINERLANLVATLANIADIAITDPNEAGHFSALVTTKRDQCQSLIDAAEAHFQRDRERFNTEPVMAKRLQIMEQTIREAKSTKLLAQHYYGLLLSKERKTLVAGMERAQARFNRYPFATSDSQTLEATLQAITAALDAVHTLGIVDPNELGHLSALLIAEKEALQTHIRSAETQHQAVMTRFNAEPIIAKRLQAMSEALRTLPSTLTFTAKRHYRALLTAEHNALAASMATAQTRFRQYPFAPAFARGSWENSYFDNLSGRTVDGTFQAIVTALANVSTIAIADPNELAHLSALLASARDTLQTHISAAEAEYQAAMVRFNTEPVVAKRLQAISHTICPTSQRIFSWTRNPNAHPEPNLTPIAKQHYKALLKAAERLLQASVIAAQTRLATYRLNDPLTTVHDRLARVVSTLADIPSLAIVDPNEAAHFTALLTSERSRLQHCLDVKTAEARFQIDRDRFNAEPSMTTRLTAIDETIRTADAQGLAAKQHYLSLLTAERQALNTSIAAAQEKFNQYLFANQPDIKARHQTVVVTLSETRLQPVLPDPNANAHLTELLSKERDTLQAQKEQQELLLIQQAAEKESFLRRKAETGLLLSPEEIQRYNITHSDTGRYTLMVAANFGS